MISDTLAVFLHSLYYMTQKPKTKEPTMQKTVEIIEEIRRDLKYYEAEIESRVENLISSASSIKRDMERLIEQFSDRGVNANFNSLGEIQSRGCDMDRQLGELAVMRDLLRKIGRVAKRETQGGEHGTH